LESILTCRTAARGGHVWVCDDPCTYTAVLYNSCSNRHCPTCGDAARRRWLHALSGLVLPVPHFQAVFTLPEELRLLARRFPVEVYDILFRAAAETLNQLAAKRMGAQLGMIGVLHTWTREMLLHPHVHFLVTAGGLSLDGDRWVPTSARWLFPVGVMRTLLRGKVLAWLDDLFKAGKIAFCANATESGRIWARVKRALYGKRWVVFVEPPKKRNPTAFISYLASYVFRVAISEHRIIAHDDATVTFRTRGENRITLSGGEFLRRFLLHVLPDGFRKVRYYGVLSPALRKTRYARARQALGSLVPEEERNEQDAPEVVTPQERVVELPVCPVCGRAALHCYRLPPLPEDAALRKAALKKWMDSS